MTKSRWSILAATVFLIAGLGVAEGEAGLGLDGKAERFWAWAQTMGDDVRAMTDFTIVRVLNPSGAQVVALGPDEGGDGVMVVGDTFGNPRASAEVDIDGSGQLAVTNNGGQLTFAVHGALGFFSVFGDVAETFPSDVGVEQGTVMVIDGDRPGYVKPSAKAYDRRVAGVVAGANGYTSAITLKGLGQEGDRSTVTLTGTVYCRVTNANGPIQAGDLLTTSDVAGHAMRVTDHEAAHGAVLGKAMENLDEESGMILILANLQ